MSLRDEVRRIGYGALLGAAVLVILALLVQALARRSPAAPPPTVAEKTQDRILHPREIPLGPSVTLERYRPEGPPAWWTAQTTYPLPLPPERPSEAPAAAAGPSVVPLKETGRPEKAACVKVGRKTVWSGRYRWRCIRR